MQPTLRFLVLLLCLSCVGLLGACASIRSDPVQSSGTPVNHWADPGSTDLPGAPLTGAQPENR